MRPPLLSGCSAGTADTDNCLSTARSGRVESWDLWPGSARSPFELALRTTLPRMHRGKGATWLGRRVLPQSPGASLFLSAMILPSNPRLRLQKAALWPRPLSPGWRKNLPPRAPVTKPILGCGRREVGRGGQAEDFARWRGIRDVLAAPALSRG